MEILHTLLDLFIGALAVWILETLFLIYKTYVSVKENEEQIILFDGICNLCDSFVIFILQNDSKKRYKFSSISSEYSNRLLLIYMDPAELNIFQNSPKSVVLLDGENIYFKSEAVIRVLTGLGGSNPLWFLCGFLLVFPTFIRDIVYDFIANRRYQWFGQSDHCLMPKPEYKDRFPKMF